MSHPNGELVVVFLFLLRAKKCVRLATFQTENGSVQLLVLQLIVELSSAKRSQRSTVGRKIWLLMIPGNFGSHRIRIPYYQLEPGINVSLTRIQDCHGLPYNGQDSQKWSSQST